MLYTYLQFLYYLKYLILLVYVLHFLNNYAPNVLIHFLVVLVAALQKLFLSFYYYLKLIFNN
ncbi:hypothetical protein U3516DRAFT_894573 [Neocallimastix sp. 'constans']